VTKVLIQANLYLYVGLFDAFHMAGGQEAKKSCPDFIAVKARIGAGIPRDHVIVSILEIKTDPIMSMRWHDQIMRYMSTARDHPEREQNLVGFLICGRTARKYWIDDENSIRWGSRFDLFDDPNDTLTMTLCEIASTKWN